MRAGDHRHAASGVTNLTPVGFEQVLERGQYYRRRYIAGDAPFKINGISEDVLDPLQMSLVTDADRGLQSSANAFLQGLYPVGPSQTPQNVTASEQRNNTYQLVPMSFVGQRSLAEPSVWLQDASSCNDNRTMKGMQVATTVVHHFNNVVSGSANTPFLALQFGGQAAFAAFNTLVNLTVPNAEIRAPTFASSMLFELFANGNSTAIPTIGDLQVRFYFHNGTAATSVEPMQYLLFGGTNFTLPWTNFAEEMNKISISSPQQWCELCGDESDSCGALLDSLSSPAVSNNNGISSVIAGVIGAMVTLGVVLGLFMLVFLLGRLKIIPRQTRQQLNSGSSKVSSISEVTKEA